MAAVIDRTTALRRFMHSAQELPLTGPHFRTSSCRTRRIVEQEADDKVVALVYEEAAEFVKPEGAVDAFWLRGDQHGCLACDWDNVLAVDRFAVVIMEGFEVFLELKGGVEL